MQLEFARLRGFYNNDFELPAPVDPDLAGYATNLPLHFARNSPEDDGFSAGACFPAAFLQFLFSDQLIAVLVSASVSQRFPLSASGGSPGAARPARSGSAAVTQAPEPTGKRRYRRHPKPEYVRKVLAHCCCLSRSASAVRQLQTSRLQPMLLFLPMYERRIRERRSRS